MQVSEIVNKLNSLIKEKKYYEALSFLASLSKDDYTKLKTALEKGGYSPSELLTALAKNSIIGGKPLDDVVALVQKLEPRILHNIGIGEFILSKAIELAREGKYEEAINYINTKLKTYQKYISEDNLKKIKDLMNDLERIVLYNKVIEELNKAKSIEDVKKIVQKVTDIIPEEEKEKLNIAEIYDRLETLAQTKDFAKASELLSKVPEKYRTMLAAVFIYLVKDKLAPEDLDKLTEFAEKFGVKQITKVKEITQSREEVKKAVRTAIDETTYNYIVNDIMTAFKERSVEKLEEILKKYGEILSQLEYNGVKLDKLMSSMATYIFDEPKIKIIYEVYSKIEKELTTYSEKKKKNPDYKLAISVGEAEKAIKAIDEVKKHRDDLILLEKAGLVKGLKEFLDSLDNLKASLYLAIGIYYADRGDKRGLKYLEKAAELNKDYIDMYAIYKASLSKDLSDIECILRAYGILPSGRGVAMKIGRKTRIIAI